MSYFPTDPIERLELFLTNREDVHRRTGVTSAADDYASQLAALKQLRAENAALRAALEEERLYIGELESMSDSITLQEAQHVVKVWKEKQARAALAGEEQKL